LQLSSRLLTKACTRVLEASDVSDCLIALSRRKWKKQDRLSAATWLVMVSWPSSRIPRSLTTDENGTVVFCNFSVWTVTLSSCWRVPSQMILLSSPRLASGDCWPSSYGSAFLVLRYDLSLIWWLLRHVCNQIVRSIRAAKPNIAFFMLLGLLLKSKIPNTLTERNARLSNLLTVSCTTFARCRWLLCMQWKFCWLYSVSVN